MIKTRKKSDEALKIRKAKIPYKLSEVSFQTIYEDEDFNLRNCQVSEDSLEGEVITSPIFTQVIFENMNLMNVFFENTDLTDVIFRNCDLSNANFSEASFFRVEL